MFFYQLFFVKSQSCQYAAGTLGRDTSRERQNTFLTCGIIAVIENIDDYITIKTHCICYKKLVSTCVLLNPEI